MMFRSYFKLLLFIVAIQSPLYASDSNISFEQGVTAYQNEQYEQAVSAFEAVVQSGEVSGDLFFNLGNAYLQTQQIGKAVLNYEKALLLNPKSKEIKTNLDIAQESILNPLSHIPDFILLEWWRSMANGLGVTLWIILHLLFLIAALVIAIGKWTSYLPAVNDILDGWRLYVALLVTLLLSAICLAAANTRQQHIHNNTYVVIMNEDTPLNDGPDERSNEITALSEGVKGKILDQINNWYKLQMEDKDEGWVNIDAVELIKI